MAYDYCIQEKQILAKVIGIQRNIRGNHKLCSNNEASI